MAKTRRVELLLEPKQYERLEEIARSKRESVGALIRRAIEKEYLQPTQSQKRAALDRLLQQETDFGSWDQIKKDISAEVVKSFAP